MKKIIACVICAVCVCGLWSMACASYNEEMGHCYDERDLYSLTTVVCDFDYENDLVYCEDFNGEVWCFEGIEDWVLGDIASFVMYNHKTPIIYDDEIINVKYCGWFDGWEG